MCLDDKSDSAIPLLKHCLPNSLCIKCKLLIIAYEATPDDSHLSEISSLTLSPGDYTPATLEHAKFFATCSVTSHILHRGLSLSTLEN